MSFPDTSTYNGREEIETRLGCLNERMKTSAPQKRSLQNHHYREMVMEVILLDVKLKVNSGASGKVKKRRLNRVSGNREEETQYLINELCKIGSESPYGERLLKFVEGYKSDCG